MMEDRSGEEVAWLDVLGLAEIEVSSEDELFPVTQALGHALTMGWRSAEPGPQVLRLLFRTPQRISRVWIDIADRVSERSQEMSLWAKTAGGEMREVARQQFTFSPAGSTEEVEDFQVALDGVTVLELRLDPDRSHDPADAQMFAVLKSFWIA